jgi:membrane protease YdiL (CAAX protease family)
MTTSESKPIHPFAAAGWTVVVSLLVMLVLGIVESAHQGAASDLVTQTAAKALSYSVVVFVMLRVYAPDSPMREAIAFRSVSPLHVLLSAVAGGGVAPALAKLDALIIARFPPPQELLDADEKILAGSHGVLIGALVVVVPIADEVFFRGILFTGVRRARGAGTAMLLTALLYGASLGSNFDPRGAASAFVIGLVVAWVRAQSGSVISAVTAHVAYMAASIVPLVMGRDEEAMPLRWVAASMAAAIVALVGGSLLAAKAPAHDD